MISTDFSIKKLSDIFCVLAVILVPELFKKLRETPGNNFHQVSSKSDPGCPSNLMLSHLISFLSWENVIEFSQDPPGSLPVDSR